MARISGGGPGPVAPRILYQDAAQLEALKSDMDQGLKTRMGSPARFPQGMLKAILTRAGQIDPVVGRPALPRSLTQRPDARQLHAMTRDLVVRHGRLSEVGKQPDTDPEGRLLATLRALLEAQDRVEIRVAQTSNR